MLKSFALLPFLALAASAQQIEPGVVPPMTFKTPNIFLPSPHLAVLRQSCPIGISARPGSAPHSLMVASVEGIAKPFQVSGRTGVHVRLVSFSGETITHLTVTVTYRVIAEGFVPAGMRPRQTRQQTFELTAQDADVLDRNLLVEGHVQIQRVSVIQVDYSDGTQWKATGDTDCSIRPSPTVLVASNQGAP